MNILAITEYLGEEKYLEPLKNVINTENIDVLVFTGGIARGKGFLKEYMEGDEGDKDRHKTKDEFEKELENKERDMNTFMGFLESIQIPAAVIPGRTDSPVSLYEEKVEQRLINSPNLHSAHLKYAQIGGFLFSGCGGLVSDESEDYFQYKISANRLMNRISNLQSFKQKKIFLFHTAPELPGISSSYSSSKLKDLIKELGPKFVFYSMTEPENKMKVIDDTVTVNPGALYDGNYAIVNTTNMSVEFKKLKSG